MGIIANIDNAVNINGIVNRFDVACKYRFIGIIDRETFEAMDFAKLQKHDDGIYTLTRNGYAVPHRIYIARRRSRGFYCYGI
jgi:hypothetical protein